MDQMLPTIKTECSQFLTQSLGLPLLKNLPKHNSDGFRKVKVRKKKVSDNIEEIFNDTFKDYDSLLQRSIFCHGVNGFNPSIGNGELEPFYIFPINGYKFMYANNVSNATETYRDTLDKFLDNYGESGVRTFQEVLKYQYSFDELDKALMTSNEIIVYNIPYYYAIRYSLIDNYETFLT